MTSSLSSTISFSIITNSSHGNFQDPNKQKLGNVKLNGNTVGSSKVESSLIQKMKSGLAINSVDYSVKENPNDEQIRQNIPTKKIYVDPFRQGLIIEQGVVYRQTIVVRSYEVGADKTATLESIFNLLQDTALNHAWMMGFLSNGFGTTHGMAKHNLIWVVSRMEVEIDQYPIWGEVVEIDTWIAASGKIGMRRDWLIRSQATGQIYARATSTWAMMNEVTRRLSKMPEEVRAEISSLFIEKHAINKDVPEKIVKLDNKAKYSNSDLKPKRSDLDVNQHVNNVKYITWLLETIPDQFLASHQLYGITLEYKRECGISDVVQSLCEPEDGGFLNPGIQQNNEMSLLNEFSSPASEIIEEDGFESLEKGPSGFTHLLQAKGENQKNEEIVRGKTNPSSENVIGPTFRLPDFSNFLILFRREAESRILIKEIVSLSS
ncbi:hypothetical protein ACFE04_030745 [Oxalis oulophora]